MIQNRVVRSYLTLAVVLAGSSVSLGQAAIQAKPEVSASRDWLAARPNRCLSVVVRECRNYCAPGE